MQVKSGSAANSGKSMAVDARAIAKGTVSGKALVSKDAISFFGGVDPKTGIVVEKGHCLEGKCIAGRVLIFPRGKGSTVGSYVMLQLKKNGVAPCAIINQEAEPIIAVGAIISGIPMVDKLEGGAYARLKDGMQVRVDGTKGEVDIGE
jgi:predicted aconitase with swiveling domain